jgi:hypothetical protein
VKDSEYSTSCKPQGKEECRAISNKEHQSQGGNIKTKEAREEIPNKKGAKII